MHIIPIYGAKGYESRYIPYLSPKWMEMLRYTIEEARRLEMDVDMTLGTGWCFGGPNVPEHHSGLRATCKLIDVPAGGKLETRFAPGTLLALVAYDASGKPTEITDRVDAKGNVTWKPRGGCVEGLRRAGEIEPRQGQAGRARRQGLHAQPVLRRGNQELSPSL